MCLTSESRDMPISERNVLGAYRAWPRRLDFALERRLRIFYQILRAYVLKRAGAGLTSSVSKVCICGILVYRAYFSTSYFVIFSIHFSFASHQAINCGRLHCDV